MSTTVPDELAQELLKVIVEEIGSYEVTHSYMQGMCAAAHARVMDVLNERLLGNAALEAERVAHFETKKEAATVMRELNAAAIAEQQAHAATRAEWDKLAAVAKEMSAALSRISGLQEKYPGWCSQYLYEESQEIAGQALIRYNEAMKKKDQG